MYIVTGGCGFIGSHLVEELVERGNKVVVIDNLHTGSAENIKHLLDNVKLIKGDASVITEVSDIVEGVFHLGIYSSSPMYKKDPSLVSKVVENMIKILEFCKKRKCKLVYASTSSIYNGNPIPWHEDMTIRVTDYYTEARYYCERLARLYEELHGVKSVGLRLFSIYGEREEFKGKYANVFTQMIWAKLRGEKFIIYGDGTQTRDLVYVKDAVEAFILAMEKDVTGIFNVGSGKAYSFNEMAKMIGVSVQYVENPIKNYVYHTLADTRRARELLGFETRVSIREGLEKCLRYYEKTLLKH